MNRPEVILNGCPTDGASLFRLYGADGVVFECAKCGYRAEKERQAVEPAI